MQSKTPVSNRYREVLRVVSTALGEALFIPVPASALQTASARNVACTFEIDFLVKGSIHSM
jgi:hypothetical protein